MPRSLSRSASSSVPIEPEVEEDDAARRQEAQVALMQVGVDEAVEEDHAADGADARVDDARDVEAVRFEVAPRARRRRTPS